MIYQNIEIFNVSDLTPDENGGMITHRYPLAVEAALSEQGKRMNLNATGVEFRFRITGERVILKLRMPDRDMIGSAYVYRGSVIDGDMRYIRGDRVTELVIEPVADMSLCNTITEAGGFPFDPNLVRVVLNNNQIRFWGVEGDCEPPRPQDRPRRTYLAYGSSITHGSFALGRPHTFAFMTAEALRADYRNLGLAGACRLEPEVAQHIAEMGRRGEWDFATLCMGINVLSWEPEMIEERVRYMIKTVADANPEKHIFCISPIYCNSDRKNNGLADRWRAIIKRLVAEYSSPFVHYVSGLQLLGGSWGLSADHVHPSPLGIREIAQNLTGLIAPHLL